MTPAPKSTVPAPFCSVTSHARLTVTGGFVRTGTATAAAVHGLKCKQFLPRYTMAVDTMNKGRVCNAMDSVW